MESWMGAIMVDVSNLGEMIRLPFEWLGKIINFVLEYFLSISIMAGAIYFVYWIFKKGIIKRLTDYINERRKQKPYEEAINRPSN